MRKQKVGYGVVDLQFQDIDGEGERKYFES